MLFNTFDSKWLHNTPSGLLLKFHIPPTKVMLISVLRVDLIESVSH